MPCGHADRTCSGAPPGREAARRKRTRAQGGEQNRAAPPNAARLRRHCACAAGAGGRDPGLAAAARAAQPGDPRRPHASGAAFGRQVTAPATHCRDTAVAARSSRPAAALSWRARRPRWPACMQVVSAVPRRVTSGLTVRCAPRLATPRRARRAAAGAGQRGVGAGGAAGAPGSGLAPRLPAGERALSHGVSGTGMAPRLAAGNRGARASCVHGHSVDAGPDGAAPAGNQQRDGWGTSASPVTPA